MQRARLHREPLVNPLSVQAGEAVAFFVSKNGASDGIDAWVASVLNAGFGGGGDAAQIEVLSRIAQVPPLNLLRCLKPSVLLPAESLIFNMPCAAE